MFCSRQSNKLINKVHERSLRLTYKDETKDFQQILREKNEITAYQRNLQVLMTEVYKVVNGIAPPIMNSLFQLRCNTNNIRNLRKQCFSVRFCDNSLLVIIIRLQLFHKQKCTQANCFTSKGFSSDRKILMLLLSVLFHLQNRVSVF